ncbi:MAG: twin-arginine translocation signal domain-containing protein, partial [Longimicrobiales bacterium]
MSIDVDRRDFLRTAALAGAGLGLGACRTGGAAPVVSANPSAAATLFTAPQLERVRIGFVGVGHQGSAHVQNFVRIDGVDIVAICDVTPANL